MATQQASYSSQNEMQYNIASTRNLTTSQDVVYVNSGGNGRDSDLDEVSDGDMVNGRQSRYTQTLGHIFRDKSGDTYISQNLHHLKVVINHEAMDTLRKNNFAVDNVEDAVVGCLMRLNWNGDEILRKALTGFKLKLKKEMMPNLFKEFMDIVTSGEKLQKIQKLTQELLDKFSMKWLGTDIGSLVFIFEHKSEEDCRKTLEGHESKYRQREVIGVLQTYLLPSLPSLVPEDVWEVFQYSMSEQDFYAWQTQPAPLHQVPSVYSEERSLLRIEQKLEEVLEKMKSSLQQSLFTEINRLIREELPKYFPVFNQQEDHTEEDPDITVPDGSMETYHPNVATKRPYGLSFSHYGHVRVLNAAVEVAGQTLKMHPKDLVEPSSLTKGPSDSVDKGNLPKISEHQLEEMGGRKDVTERSPSPAVSKEFLRTFVLYKDPEDVEEPFSENVTYQETATTSRPPPTPPEGDSSEEEKEGPPPKKSREELVNQAEQLLNWVNVKSRASQSKDPEIVRMMEQVVDALDDEKKPAPKAKALDTVLVLDTSDSIADRHLDTLKSIAHTFVDGIEEMVDSMNLEENLAIVQIGKGRAWVRQHLTNDYSRVRDTIDDILPDSSMATGGKTPLFQALMVCLGAIEGRGGVVNVAGCHRVRPRIIMVTDGRPTDEATEHGKDIQTNVNEVKFALVQLVTEFASKKHKTTPSPIFWVPVGSSPDRPFLESLAELSNGKVVEPENVHELCRYYKVQETIGCVYKMVRKHAEMQTKEQIMTVVTALAGNLHSSEKEYIVEEVCKKQKEPDSEQAEADDFDGVFEDRERVASGKLLALGTRVVRGKDWKWNNQDKQGAGTVIQHRNKDSWIYVMWDHGTHNAYRYGDGDRYDVEMTDQHPRILSDSQLIEVGVEVEKGKGWSSGEDVGDGKGVVIRKRKDGKVKVRWNNGHIGKYRFTSDNAILQVCEVSHGKTKSVYKQQSTIEEEEEGAVGGYDASKGMGRCVWYWGESKTDSWNLYDAELQVKLNSEYKRRPDGSCVVRREGLNRRVLFKTNQEKTVDRGLVLEVKSEVISEHEYEEKLLKEK